MAETARFQLQKIPVGSTTYVTQMDAFMDAVDTAIGRAHWKNAADYASIKDACDAIGTVNLTTLVISTAMSAATTGPVTISANISVFPVAPGVISKGSATSLTIKGPVVGNPMHQWLNGFAAGEVTFGTVGTTQIGFCSTVWWGLKTTASDAVNSTALACAISSGINVVSPPGSFSYDTGLVIINSMIFRGSGGLPSSAGMNNFTKFTYTGTGIAISLTDAHQNKQLMDFALIGNPSATGGIHIGSVGYSNTNRLHKIYIGGFNADGAYGLRVRGHYNIIEAVEASGNYYGLYTYTGDACNANKFIGCKFRSSLKYGAYIMDAAGSAFYDCSFEGNQYEGTYVYSANVKQLSFYSCYWESNMGTGGNASITLSGASASDRPTFINFYSPNSEETPMFYLDKAQDCTIVNPRVTPGGRIKIEANAVSIKVLGSNLLTFATGTYNHVNGIYWGESSGGAGILSANSTPGATLTPNVSDYNHMYHTANTATTTYTNFLYGRDGQTITIVFRDSLTTIDFTAATSNLVGNGGVDWTPSVNDHMVCTYLADSGKWHCKISDNTI